jgi:hypothetical protein
MYRRMYNLAAVATIMQFSCSIFLVSFATASAAFERAALQAL